MRDDEHTGEERRWHVNRGVPVALLISMTIFFVTQISTTIWFAAKIDSRVDVLEKAQLAASPLAERMTRVEEKLGPLQQGINEIKTTLSQMRR